ncbi:prenyltransferase/squalene oxidase repeat-containing protein [Streptomyces sp. NPDC052077]|uniref:prenyltransferase/squalene oxidase repeat-containing protein n=1 Tax=Streptomyces sp. NPDC052077 TaxID=3154757 RepID=UPI0034444272
MNVRRRSAAVLAAMAVLGGAAAPAVAADPSPSASPGTPPGLYGKADPRYDGVWRQSLTLLAQDTVRMVPSERAVAWLTGQQCADGSFAAFRADPDAACGTGTMVDSNSTAVAVQALAALGGHDKAVGDALTWLTSVQNKDGGWGYTPGSPSDANSTAVVIGALAATGADPAATVKGGRSPYDALLTFALPCAKDKGDGAFAYQPDKDGRLTANEDATAAAVLAALGKGLVTGPGKADGTAPACADPATREQAAANGAAHLARAVAEDGHLTSSLPGAEDQPDVGNTADTVVALAARSGAASAAGPLAWLEKNAGAWAEQSGPAAYAQLILAAHATGTDPRDFGGTDLVSALNALGPAPEGFKAGAETPGEDGAKDKKDEKKKDDGKDDSGFGLWWFVGVCLVFGVGIGFLLSGRNRKSGS